MNDDNPRVGPPPGGGWATAIRTAIGFYSRLPAGGGADAPRLERIAPAVPLAGVVIGIGPAVVLAGMVLAGVPALFAAAAALVAATILTGAMAEDGLADAMDGLFGGATPERRLEILKDPRHGTYGVCSVVLGYLLRATALASIAFGSPVLGALAWLGLGVAARSFALWLPATMRPARPDGAAAAVGILSLSRFAAGAAIAAVLALVALLPLAGPAGAVIVLAAMAATILGWRALCHLLVGGHTGDLIGSGQLLLEIAGLSLLMVWVT